MMFEAKTGFRAAFTFFCFPDVKMAHILVSFSLFLSLQEKVKKLGTGGFELEKHEKLQKCNHKVTLIYIFECFCLQKKLTIPFLYTIIFHGVIEPFLRTLFDKSTLFAEKGIIACSVRIGKRLFQAGNREA